MNGIAKKEGIIERTTFLIVATIKTLTPPFASLERLEKYCKARIQENQNAYTPRWFLADIYQFHQKNEDAKRLYIELENLGYIESDQQFKLGEVFYALKEYAEATERFERIATRYDHDKRFNYYIGISYMRQGLYEKALPRLKRASEMSERRRIFTVGVDRHTSSIDEVSLYEAIGYCSFRLGQFYRSAEAYRKALSLGPGSLRAAEVKNNAAKAHIHFGNELLEKDQKNDAIEQFHLALTLEPDDRSRQEVQRMLAQLGDIQNDKVAH